MGRYERSIKHTMDRMLAGLGLVLLSPLFAAIALAIRLTDGWPAFFRQTRVGAHGEPFTVMKFRTYPVDAPNVASHEAEDLRPFPFGSLLRRFSLDELPQLINVARGEMALVGPRPPLPSQEDVISGRRHCGALRLRPGMTGLSQVHAYDDMPSSAKVQFDCQYASRVTWSTDLWILVRTIAYVFRHPPTY
jgi:O-antigen biosynthesis protein WbqP